MEDTYVDKLKQWIELDNSVAKLKDELSVFVEEKKDLEEEILQYVEDNKLDKVTVSTSDGSLKFSKRKISQSITIKYIKNTLEKYVQQEGISGIDIDSVCKFLSSNLETKSKTYIKRDVIDG